MPWLFVESSGETLCEMIKGDVAVGLVVFHGVCGGCLWMERSADDGRRQIEDVK